MTKVEKKFLKNLQKLNDRCLTTTINENTYFYFVESEMGWNWFFANNLNDLKQHIFWFSIMMNVKDLISDKILDKLILEENPYEVVKNNVERRFIDCYYKLLESNTFDEINQIVNDLVKLINNNNFNIVLYDGARKAYTKALALDQKFEAEEGEITFSKVLEDILGI